MAALQRQMVFSLSDLRFVSVECGNCHAVLTLDMNKLSAHQEKHEMFVPGGCSACYQPFDSAIENLRLFRKYYQTLLPIAPMITFRGEMESAATGT